jgi:Ala-tRNA(Pro) deacylase
MTAKSLRQAGTCFLIAGAIGVSGGIAGIFTLGAELHGSVYTWPAAQQVAAEEHVPGRMVAKTVVLVTHDGFVLAVLPAPLRVDIHAIRAALGKPAVRLASEAEFAGLFPDSETGAMAPFGNLYGLPVYVDESLSRAQEIVFNAGTHRDTIRMRFDDFVRLVEPEIVSLALMKATA